MRLRKAGWLVIAVIGIGLVAYVPSPINVFGCLVLAIGVGEWVAVDEEWKYRDVRDYLKREGFIR